MTVTPAVIEEFVWNLARLLAGDWECGHVVGLNIVGCLVLSLRVVPRGASCHSELQPQGGCRRAEESQGPLANVEATDRGFDGRLLCVRLRGG